MIRVREGSVAEDRPKDVLEEITVELHLSLRVEGADAKVLAPGLDARVTLGEVRGKREGLDALLEQARVEDIEPGRSHGAKVSPECDAANDYLPYAVITTLRRRSVARPRRTR